MKLEFGRPSNSLQALIRLPDRNHPRYKEDKSIEHVAHFRGALINIGSQLVERETIPIYERWIPLKIDDIKLLSRFSSFIRKPEPIFTASWKFIDVASVWGIDHFPTGDDAYLWWQISEMEPDLGIPGFELICVETNDQFDKPTHGNDHSDFDIFVMDKAELRSLIEELS